jgi:hypothetical protein
VIYSGVIWFSVSNCRFRASATGAKVCSSFILKHYFLVLLEWFSALNCWFLHILSRHITHKPKWSFPYTCQECTQSSGGVGAGVLNRSTGWIRVFSSTCRLLYQWGHHLHYVFNAIPASCSRSTGICNLRGKLWLEHETDNTPPSNAKFKNG